MTADCAASGASSPIQDSKRSPRMYKAAAAAASVFRNFKNCSVMSSRLASMCKSDMNSDGQAQAPPSVRAAGTRSIRRMMTGFNGAPPSKGPMRPRRDIADLDPTTSMPLKRDQTLHSPTASDSDRVPVVAEVDEKLRISRRAVRGGARHSHGCRVYCSGRCRIR